MKKITGRSVLVLLLTFAVLTGVVFYSVKLFTYGSDWALYFSRANSGSTGTIYDRNGILLASFSPEGNFYSDDSLTRKACFHIIGDYDGRTDSGLLSTFTADIGNYSMYTGTTHAEDYVFTLTIDSDLNEAAYNAVGDDRDGAVLICNYKTGEILCLLSAPSIDPLEHPDELRPGTYINKCISASFVPGSVFKLITTAAAIETVDGIWDRSFFCEGSHYISSVEITCLAPHWTQDIRGALANSCNCAFADIAVSVGQDNMKKYVSDYGFTETHSLNGMVTAAGSYETDYMGDPELAWSGIGQWTDLICPFSLLRFVSAVANGGMLVEPTVIAGTESVSQPLVKASTASNLKEMMRNNVVEHYGEDRFPGLNICAKTGTAELGDGRNNSWITGFLDDPEHPYAFVVLIENGGYGITDAGAVANEVLHTAVNK